MPEDVIPEMMNVVRDLGGERNIFNDDRTAHLVAEGHRILSMRPLPGLEVDARETDDGISAKVRVLEGTVIEKPVHLCFGIIHKTGIQKIKMDVRLEKRSSVTFIAHCIFPNAMKVQHIMDAVIDVGENATMNYSEVHYHGIYGGIEVMPRALIKVGKNGRFISDFTLTSGRVGKLAIDYDVEAGENAVVELTARVFGHGFDEIDVKEKVALQGKDSKGLIKARIAIEDNATSGVQGITQGNAEGARGHVDCMEIVKDNATAKAIPMVSVTHPLAKVTHEAAIGSVDKRQIETLMAHGLTPEEAVDVIVMGILR